MPGFASISPAAAATGHNFLLAFFTLFLIVNPVSGQVLQRLKCKPFLGRQLALTNLLLMRIAQQAQLLLAVPMH